MYKITINVIESLDEIKAIKKECSAIDCGGCRHYNICGSERGYWFYNGIIKKNPYALHIERTI